MNTLSFVCSVLYLNVMTSAMASSNSIFEVVFSIFCRNKIFMMDTQFKDFIDPIKVK